MFVYKIWTPTPSFIACGCWVQINPLPLFVQLVFAVKDPSTDTLEVTVFDRDMFSPNGKKWQNALARGDGGSPTLTHLCVAVIAQSPLRLHNNSNRDEGWCMRLGGGWHWWYPPTAPPPSYRLPWQCIRVTPKITSGWTWSMDKMPSAGGHAHWRNNTRNKTDRLIFSYPLVQ